MLSSASQLYLNKNTFDFSIILPVYNEGEKIGLVLEKIKQVLQDCVETYEIIVVNDGSTDDTLAALERISNKDSTIRILSYRQNAGKGHAVKAGILACEGSKCLFMDGDMDISPTRLRDYFAQLESTDLVVASKRHESSHVDASRSRMILSSAFSVFVRLVTGISVKDTQSGLKAGNSLPLKKIFSSMVISRYAFDVELLLIATRAGLDIREMPVDLRLHKKFKVRDIIAMSGDVLRIACKHRIRSRELYKRLVA